jgi:MBG domain (YGX type)
MSFGGPVPALTVTYVGFVNGDTPASLTTPVELSTSATSDSPAGAYAIMVGGAGSPDYTINDVDGTITEQPYLPPPQSRYRAAAAFVTTLYAKIAGEGPEPVAFMYWMGRYLAHESPMKVTRGFAQSIKPGTSGNAGARRGISLRVVCNDAEAAARRAAR